MRKRQVEERHFFEKIRNALDAVQTNVDLLMHDREHVRQVLTVEEMDFEVRIRGKETTKRNEKTYQSNTST